jgi:DNA-directed RNA polymerase subunit alpha
MLVKFGKQEKPRTIAVDEESATPTYARFVAEPFERVYGHAFGNALRRIMLASLETPGIISVRIEGVPHEFMAVEGIASCRLTKHRLAAKAALCQLYSTLPKMI